jgi:hypothetical protein
MQRRAFIAENIINLLRDGEMFLSQSESLEAVARAKQQLSVPEGRACRAVGVSLGNCLYERESNQMDRELRQNVTTGDAVRSLRIPQNNSSRARGSLTNEHLWMAATKRQVLVRGCIAKPLPQPIHLRRHRLRLSLVRTGENLQLRVHDRRRLCARYNRLKSLSFFSTKGWKRTPF